MGSGPVPELARCVHPTPHSPNQLPRTPAVASRDALAGGSRSAVCGPAPSLYFTLHSTVLGTVQIDPVHTSRVTPPQPSPPRARGGTNHACPPGLGRMAETFVELCFTLRAFGLGLGMVTLSTHPHPHHHRPCERARAHYCTHAPDYLPTHTNMHVHTHPPTHNHAHTPTHIHTHTLTDVG